jgi:hypothetical protein
MLELINIVMTRVLNMNFLPNILRNKMVLLKGRIGLSLIWLGLCWGEGKGATPRSKSSLITAGQTGTEQAGTPFT